MASRRLIPLALLVAGVAAIALAFRRSESEAGIGPLRWIATAHQFGPVGYRDPAGAISPDGQWIAYSEGRFLRVRAIEGGPVVELPPEEAQIRNISWTGDSRTILADGYGTQAGWAMYDIVDRTRHGVGEGAERMFQGRDAVVSRDGQRIAGIVNGPDGQALQIVSAGGVPLETRQIAGRARFPAWTSSGDVACVTTADGRSRVTIPCGGSALRTDPDRDAYGPIAFAPDGTTVYVALSNPDGYVDLWAAPTSGGRARRLTAFSRDTHAPSVTADGLVLFKVQSYRTAVAVAPSAGGASLRLAAFQSETPSWDPTGRWIGITYGTWRRVVDDANYPDIAQDAGIIESDPGRIASAPVSVVHASASEDQSLCWSPNGRWIAFHSHKDQSDDIWIRPASAASDAAAPRRISFLGRGAEAGWPRWSADGRWLLFSASNRDTRRTVLYAIGVDQDTGGVTSEAREIAIRGVQGDVTHGEWLPDSSHVAAIGKEGPGRHVIITIPRAGGDAHVVRRFASEHDAPGLAVSPDGADVAFIAPAGDGFFQVFRMPLGGGEPAQVTTDPSNKTQPAWSPDGRRIAFTVWNYDAQFWAIGITKARNP